MTSHAMSAATHSKTVSAQPGKPAASRTAAPPRLVLTGSEGSGKKGLLAFAPPDLKAAISIQPAISSHYQADGFLITCPVTLDKEARAVELEAAAKQIQSLGESGGRVCQVAGLPVFVVLTKADLLAK